MAIGPIWNALKIVMSHNVFQFGDTFWLQLTGTAMGTPPAPAYATIYFAIHEMRRIFDEYSQYLLFYKRYLDDIFGIWYCPDPIEDERAWKSFQADMDAFGKLRWKFSERDTTATFLDMTIEFRNDGLTTTMFEKN